LKFKTISNKRKNRFDSYIIREREEKKHEYGDEAKLKRKILMQEEKKRKTREKKIQYNLVAPKQVIF
jgi:hypothetical protein